MAPRREMGPAKAPSRALLLLLVSAIFSAGLWTQPSSARVATPGHRLWVALYDGPEGGSDEADAVAVSPDGTRLYVTGYSVAANDDQDYTTLAYDAATGGQLWVSNYDGPDHQTDIGEDIAVSPDGHRVFVTGYSIGGPGNSSDYATIAYDSATGDELWAKRYDDPHGGYDDVHSMMVSPDGTKVFVTGSSWAGSGGTDYDYATVAYDAATGDQIWVQRYDGPGKDLDNAYSVAVSPDGERVFVTGSSAGRGGGLDFDYATIMYDASTGNRQWVRRYGGLGSDYQNIGQVVAVSPDGSKVFVTGSSFGGGTHDDYATIAYDATTGAQIWQRRYDGSANGDDEASALSVSADGSTVVVAGKSDGEGTQEDFATIAYNTVTGSGIWRRRYNGPWNESDTVKAVAVSPLGSEVYVTGDRNGGPQHGDFDYVTIAYELSTGLTLWTRSLNGRLNAYDSPSDMAVSPDGAIVFVTGTSLGTDFLDVATVAYTTS